MKKDTHPSYYPKAKVKCACGNTFATGSTVEEIQVEICSVCHPFYTGKQKLIDNAGRVERFKKIQSQKEKVSAVRKGKKVKKARAKAKKEQSAKKESKK